MVQEVLRFETHRMVAAQQAMQKVLEQVASGSLAQAPVFFPRRRRMGPQIALSQCCFLQDQKMAARELERLVCVGRVAIWAVRGTDAPGMGVKEHATETDMRSLVEVRPIDLVRFATR